MTVTWTQVKPLFESMFFDLSIDQMSDRTDLGAGTIYRLLSGETKNPHPRTLRDIVRAIHEWRPDAFSQMERAIAGGDEQSPR